MASELFNKMNEFWETSPIPQAVCKPLKNKAVAEVHFEGDDSTYMMIKENGRSFFREGTPSKPQLYFKYSKDAVDYMMSVEGDDKEAIEEYVDRMSTCVLNPTKERYIEVKLCTNIMTMFRMGYFGMMFVGGSRAIHTVKEVSKKLGIKIPGKFLKQ
mgnify:CR=1 FL=1